MQNIQFKIDWFLFCFLIFIGVQLIYSVVLVSDVFCFIFLVFSVLGLHSCASAFSSCCKQGLLFISEHRLQSTHTHSRAHRLQQLWRSGLVGLGHVGSSRTRDQSCVSCISKQILNQWATGEVLVLIYFGVQLIYNAVLVSGVKTDC